MPALTDAQFHALARLGAVTRLKEIEDEAAAIRKAFPGVKPQGVAPEPVPPTDAVAKPAKRKKRSHMSPEARQAAAERMRAYWAKKNSEKAAGEPVPAVAKDTPAQAKATKRKKPAKAKRASKSTKPTRAKKSA